MDRKLISATIDTYDLSNCIALLAAFAPDLLARIADDIRFRRDDPNTLAKARIAVHEALARERKAN